MDQQLERLAAGLGTGQGAGAGGPGADAEAESQAGASTVAGGRRQQQAKQKAQVKPNWKGKQEVGKEAGGVPYRHVCRPAVVVGPLYP